MLLKVVRCFKEFLVMYAYLRFIKINMQLKTRVDSPHTSYPAHSELTGKTGPPTAPSRMEHQLPHSPPTDSQTSCPSFVLANKISIRELHYILKSTSDSAPGPNNISCIIIQHFPPHLKEILCESFAEFLLTSSFPLLELLSQLTYL